MNLKGVVFDLDHTLFDRYATLKKLSPLICSNLREYIKSDITDDEFIRNLCACDKDFVIFGWERIHENLCKKNVFSKIPEFKVYKEAVWSTYTKAAVPFPFGEEVLEFIKSKGLKTGIITNGSDEMQQKKIDMLGIRKYFDAIIISGNVGSEKPDSLPFIKACEALKESPENLLYVGDNPINDVEGSRNAGFVPVWVKTCNVWVDGIKKAPYEIESIQELPALITDIISRQLLRR